MGDLLRSLLQKAQEFDSVITIHTKEKSAEATKILGVMGMEIKCGDTIVIECTGGDEEAACAGIKNFFEINL